MEFTPEQINEKYLSLAGNVKAVLGSDDIAEKVSEIAKKHSLHIDQAGVLDEEILYVALGLIKPSDFQDELAERGNIDKEVAGFIADEVNREVFSLIRETIYRPRPDTEDIEAKELVTTKDGSERDDLLSAIENPAPSVHPISIAQKSAFPEKIRPSSEATPAQNTEIGNSKNIAHEFISGKFSDTVHLPSEKTVIKTPEPKIDPYREPLN